MLGPVKAARCGKPTSRLAKCTRAGLAVPDKSADEIFGRPTT
jgi:hypothetical protein